MPIIQLLAVEDADLPPILSYITGGGQGEGTPIFSPLQVAGLVLWLRADLGITPGTGVSQWADQSGHGNNCVEGTGSDQPTYVASGINGLPSLAFNASSTQQLNGPTLSTCNQPAVVYLVAQQTSQAVVQFPFSWKDTTAAGFYSNTSSSFAVLNNNEGAQVALSTSTTSPFVATAVVNGASSSLRVNGVTATGTLGTNPLSAAGYSVGTGFGGGDFWTGSISEIIIVQGAIAPNTQLLAYLSARYGIAA